MLSYYPPYPARSVISLDGLWKFSLYEGKSFYRFGKGTGIRGKPLAFNLSGIYDRYRRPKLVAQCVAEWFAKK
ncbi:MAG: hypothetical protein PHY82_05745 [Lentisphaeria bacterium]|nr:hypothetical protein [Lentisphaeria bacterium]